MTLFLVMGLTEPELLITLDTVPIPTPANRATSLTLGNSTPPKLNVFLSRCPYYSNALETFQLLFKVAYPLYPLHGFKPTADQIEYMLLMGMNKKVIALEFIHITNSFRIMLPLLSIDSRISILFPV